LFQKFARDLARRGAGEFRSKLSKSSTAKLDPAN
jgi:hypothetical protein